MNPYRIALILCRAVTISLWWSAGIGIASGLLVGVGISSGAFGLTGFPLLNSIFSPLSGALGLAVAATFLQLFAPTLGAAMTGGAMLEGQTISSQRNLERDETALARAGAGLILLFYGLASALPSLATTGYALLTDESVGVNRGFWIYGLAGNLVPAVLRCAVGFLLAFHLGLRRLVKPQ